LVGGWFSAVTFGKNQNRTLRFVIKSLKMHLKNGIKLAFKCYAGLPFGIESSELPNAKCG
jgi:hypothetical protein